MPRKAIRQIGVILNDAGEIIGEQEPILLEILTTADGSAVGAVVNAPPSQQELVENTGTYIYEGFAAFGVATSATGWTIIRHTLSGSDITSVGNSDNSPTAEWDERAGTETYTDD